MNIDIDLDNKTFPVVKNFDQLDSYLFVIVVGNFKLSLAFIVENFVENIVIFSKLLNFEMC